MTSPRSVVVSETHGATDATSFVPRARRALDARSRGTSRTTACARGDRVLVMLTNVLPLWETMLAAMKLGAVVIPATTQLTADDVDDRIARGGVRHMVTDADGAQKLRRPERLARAARRSAGPRASSPSTRPSAAPPELAPRRDARRPTRCSSTSPRARRRSRSSSSTRTQSYPVGHLSTMYWLGLREGDVHQNISSPGLGEARVVELLRAVERGRDDPRARLRAVLGARHARRARASTPSTTLCAPPTVWRMLILEIARRAARRAARARERGRAAQPRGDRDGASARGASPSATATARPRPRRRSATRRGSR